MGTRSACGFHNQGGLKLTGNAQIGGDMRGSEAFQVLAGCALIAI